MKDYLHEYGQFKQDLSRQDIQDIKKQIGIQMCNRVFQLNIRTENLHSDINQLIRA